MAMRLRHPAFAMAAQVHIGLGDRLDRIGLALDGEAVKDAIRIEVLDLYPDRAAVRSAQRHLIGHPTLAGNVRDRLGIVQDSDGIERSAQQQDPSTKVNQPLQGRAAPQSLTQRMVFGQFRARAPTATMEASGCALRRAPGKSARTWLSKPKPR